MLNSELKNFQIIPNSFKMTGINYKIAMGDSISAGMKYWIVLDYRQKSYQPG
jgi:hypothetical protein